MLFNGSSVESFVLAQDIATWCAAQHLVSASQLWSGHGALSHLLWTQYLWPWGIQSARCRLPSIRLYVVSLKSSPKFCLIFLAICEQLLLYPFYSSGELNLETVSNVLKEPQLINGTHLCGWSKASDKSRWGMMSKRRSCTLLQGLMGCAGIGNWKHSCIELHWYFI